MTCTHERIAVDDNRRRGSSLYWVRCLDCGAETWGTEVSLSEPADYEPEEPGGWTFKRVDSNA